VHEIALRGGDSLLDRLRDFNSLANADANLALLVAHDDQNSELHLLAALDDFRDTVDIDNRFFVFLGLKRTSWHSFLLEFQSRSTGSFG